MQQFKRFGRHMQHAWAFATTYPGWHSFARDRATVGAITRLAKRGLVEINEHGQFRAIAA